MRHACRDITPRSCRSHRGLPWGHKLHVFGGKLRRKSISISIQQPRCCVVLCCVVLGRFMKERYTPLLISRGGKTLVLLGSLGLSVAGVYGVTQACFVASEPWNSGWYRSLWLPIGLCSLQCYLILLLGLFQNADCLQERTP